MPSNGVHARISHHWIGCSSCWDGLLIFANRFASVTCFHWHFCACLSMQNDFTRHAKVVSGSRGKYLAVNEAE
eukprot:6192269-Pleurochrysis_carterae.AAC.4